MTNLPPRVRRFAGPPPALQKGRLPTPTLLRFNPRRHLRIAENRLQKVGYWVESAKVGSGWVLTRPGPRLDDLNPAAFRTESAKMLSDGLK